MPKTKKGEKIMENMKREYGEEKGEKVFYASRNKGTIKGVDKARGSHKPRPKAHHARMKRLEKAKI